MNRRCPSLADAFADSLAQSAFRIRQSGIQHPGDPKFKAVEKEIKITWLK